MNPFSAASALDHVDVVVVRVVTFLTERTVVPSLPERDTLCAKLKIKVPARHHPSVGLARLATDAFDACPNVLPLAGFRRVDRRNTFGVVYLSTAVTLQHLVPLVSLAAFETSLTFGTEPVHRVNILNLQPEQMTVRWRLRQCSLYKAAMLIFEKIHSISSQQHAIHVNRWFDYLTEEKGSH